ncbi:Calcineurin-like protein phosphoesterase [Dinothrombium tinctorium]|uniref:Calcineurin-like protein phosphoesterase n=1 Tax=Dinothrombium tinctorium TaxID=1965070 RepID=A0A3S3Q0M6_9ACAR|nr:Calcineurin-like protein phosphoesterase [Dinothrombium tinctorium]
MGVKKNLAVKSIGFPSAKRSPSLESTQSVTGSTTVPTAATKETTALTPEGGTPLESFGQIFYDCCAFLIYCAKHKQIALSRTGKGSWLPFITLRSNEVWQAAAFGGLSYILAHGDMQQISQLQGLPFATPELMHLLRLQLPNLGRFIIRIVYKATVNSDLIGFVCCQNDRRIEWISADDVMNGNVERLWGPDPYLFYNKSMKSFNLEIEEFSVDDAMKFLPQEPCRNKEQEMVKSSAFKQKEALKIYSDFVQHCYPSNFMSYVSFVDYMTKLGWTSTDIRLYPTFRAFNYKATGYLSFHELFLGLVANDIRTTHGGIAGELRIGYIFRYYDADNDGFLDQADITRMIADIIHDKQENVDNAIIDKETRDRMQAIGMKTGTNVSFQQFLTAVSSAKFRGTSSLFRSPIDILKNLTAGGYEMIPQIIGTKILLDRRRIRGSCCLCRPKKYTIAAHRVQIDFYGRVQDPRNLVETDSKDISFMLEDELTEHLRAFSRETVFNFNSGANSVLEILRNFELKEKKEVNSDRKDWKSTDRNVLLNTVTALCRQAEEIFSHESRCIKVNSPCFVFGDIHGNIADLMTFERNLWKTGPSVLAANYLFLGDYVDRGDYGVECVCYLFALKILAPDKYFLCRGNHEIRSIQKVFTFHKECLGKYGTRIGPQIWEVINKAFDRMPISALIDETVFGAHGGIPTSVVKIEDLMKIPSPLQEPEGESPVAWELLWNDPINASDFKELADFLKLNKDNVHGFLSNTKRGTAFYFTEEAVDSFMQANGISFILRGHEVMQKGFKFQINGKVCTVFSSSNYCGGTNQAASIYLDGEKIRVITIETSGNSTA